MEVKNETINGVTVLTPIGRIDTSTAKIFEDAVMKTAVAGAKVMIVFSSIDYISSAGLRVVLMLGKKMKAVTGTLVLTAMATKIFDVFKMSGFNKILNICKDNEEAKQFFN